MIFSPKQFNHGHSWSIALYHAGNQIRSFENITVIHSFLFYRFLFQIFLKTTLENLKIQLF